MNTNKISFSPKEVERLLTSIWRVLLFFMSKILWILFFWKAVEAVTNVAETTNLLFHVCKTKQHIHRRENESVNLRLYS